MKDCTSSGVILGGWLDGWLAGLHTGEKHDTLSCSLRIGVLARVTISIAIILKIK